MPHQTMPPGGTPNEAAAQTLAERLRPTLEELKDLSALAAARELERRGIINSRGGKWSSRAVVDLRSRLEKR